MFAIHSNKQQHCKTATLRQKFWRKTIKKRLKSKIHVSDSQCRQGSIALSSTYQAWVVNREASTPDQGGGVQGGGSEGPCCWRGWRHQEAQLAPLHVGSRRPLSSLLHTSLPVPPLRGSLDVWATVGAQLISRNAICRTALSLGVNEWLQVPPSTCCQACYSRWLITGHILQTPGLICSPSHGPYLGQSLVSLRGHGFDFLESYQNNNYICKIIKISERREILNCEGLMGGFRTPIQWIKIQ